MAAVPAAGSNSTVELCRQETGEAAMDDNSQQTVPEGPRTPSGAATTAAVTSAPAPAVPADIPMDCDVESTGEPPSGSSAFGCEEGGPPMYVAPKTRHAKRRRANATGTRRGTGLPGRPRKKVFTTVPSAGTEYSGSSDTPSCSGSSSTAGGTGSAGGGSGRTGSNQKRLVVIAEGDPVMSGNILPEAALGMLNRRGSCYINVALQCLGCIPILRDYFLDVEALPDREKLARIHREYIEAERGRNPEEYASVGRTSTRGRGGTRTDSSAAWEFAKVVNCMWRLSPDCVSCIWPKSMQEFCGRNLKRFDPTQMHDAHDLIVSLLANFDAELRAGEC
eukprot:GHVU01105665.1.p1 GENE.GHVU01105665.1~~GHVU01105665.1.p1  ORF type:complete len:335 (+),score=50.96 GHVU01105665.1:275-1279(+)